MSNWRVVCLTVIVFAAQATQANARFFGTCLTIQDVDQRVECLEGRAQPQPEATIPAIEAPNFSPSFDCNRAASRVEILICGDSLLARLDAEMGQAYVQALKSQSNHGAFINDQRQWLSLRDSRCAFGDPSIIRSCLIQMTTARIAGLAVFAAGPATQSVENIGKTNLPLKPDVAPLNNQPVVGLQEPPANDSGHIANETVASKRLIESIQSLLGSSKTENLKFFKYNVDKKELQGFKTDMPVLRVVYDERVFFDTDKDVLRPEAIPVVKIIAATLKQQKEKVALFVAGHTDARGTEQHNLDLSIRRAEGVALAIKRQGPGAALIWRVGFGKAIPIRPNTSDNNMALNRRVEFLIASRADIITTWIKTTKGLCEDETCGTTSIVANFQAAPIGNVGAKPIDIEIPSPKPVEIEMQFHPNEVGAPLR